MTRYEFVFWRFTDMLACQREERKEWRHWIVKEYKENCRVLRVYNDDEIWGLLIETLEKNIEQLLDEDEEYWENQKNNNNICF